MSRRVAFVCGMVLALAVASVARADTVHLRDGGKLEGKVVAEEKGSITIDTALGRMVIERSRISRIEKGLTAAEELAEREKAMKADASADAWFELAEFARAKALRRDRERLLDKALARDPQHEGANLARGRVRHEGQWMTPAERDAKVKADETAAMAARGLVPYSGRFVTPEEKEHLERGDVQIDGRWLSADDAQRARGLERVGSEWVVASEVLARRRAVDFGKEASLALTFDASDHFVVASAFGKAHAHALQEASEKSFALAAGALRESVTDLAWIGGHKALAVVVDTRDDFGLFARFFSRQEKKVDARWAEGAAKVDGFYWWDPTGTSATFRGARHVDDTVAHTVHHLGHVLLNRHGYNWKFLPTWLDEGFAAWTEHRVLGRNAISCISSRRYGAEGVRKEELLSRDRWFDDAVRAIKEGKDPPFGPILKRDLSTITAEEVAKSMVVVDWLSTQKQDGFLAMLAALREQWPKGQVPALGAEAAAAHAKAFAALGIPAERLDAALRESIAAPTRR